MKINTAFLFTLSNLISRGLGAIVILLLPAIIPKIDYGIFILIFSIYNLIVIIISAGQYEILVSMKTNIKRTIYYEKTFFYNILLGIFLCAVLFISGYIEKLYLALAVSFSGASLAITQTLVKFLIIKQQTKKASSYLLSFSIISYALSFLIVLITKNWEHFFITLSIISFFNLVYLKLYFVKSTNIKISEVISLPKKFYPYILIAFSGWLTGYGFNHIIQSNLNLAEIGAFGFILTLSNLILVSANSLNLIYSSNFFKSKVESESNLDNNNWINLSYVITFISLFLYVLYPSIIRVFYDGDVLFLSFRHYILALGLSYIIYIPAWISKNYFYFKNESNLLMKLTVISVIIGVIVSFFAIENFGINGAYLGFFMNHLIQMFFISIYAQKKFNFKIDAIKIYTPGLLLLFVFVFLK